MFRVTNMRKLIICLSIVLSACSTPNTIVVKDNEKSEKITKESVKKIDERLSLAIKDINQPLDLSAYKDINFIILEKTLYSERKIVVKYDDYVKLIELLKVLENKISLQQKTIDELLKFYDATDEYEQSLVR